MQDSHLNASCLSIAALQAAQNLADMLAQSEFFVNIRFITSGAR